MVREFFKEKRPWSEYKDLILGYYLEPYIPKVNTLRRPILIVDCFAGPGKFEKDNKPGSPLIICSAIMKWRDKGVNVRGLFIEDDHEHFLKLERLLQQYAAFAAPREGKFENHLPELEQLAAKNTVFLYVDPYTVKSLQFEPMRRVYEQIQNVGTSVEVLINFNAATFMRWGLAALNRVRQLDVEDVPREEDDEPYGADDPTESVEIAELDSIAGGDFWQTIAADHVLTFPQRVEKLTEQYAQLLRRSFERRGVRSRLEGFVGYYGIKSKYHHMVPKYYLVYATRSDHGIDLMNDAMCKARREFVKHEFPPRDALFDMTPTSETVDLPMLCNDLMQIVRVDSVFTRRELRLKAIRHFFGRFSTSDYTKAVAELLKEKRLFSRSGKSRINEKERLSAKPFSTP